MHLKQLIFWLIMVILKLTSGDLVTTMLCLDWSKWKEID